MKKVICLGILILALNICLFPLQKTSAQEIPLSAVTEEKKPVTTPPDYIAMLFFRLIGKGPDFESWARLSPEYQNASKFDQISIQEQKVKELKNVFSFITLEQPLVIETPVKLSPYNAGTHGFLVDSFKADTFFPFRYNGQSYAVVPQGIIDKQWLKVSDEEAASIEKAAQNNKDRLLMMVLTLSPELADGSSPAAIGNENYWLMSAAIKRMMLYPLKGDTLLWGSDAAVKKDEKHEELLNLYQH